MKGTSIWILGFFSILSIANVVNSTIMWFASGPESTFKPFLISGLTGLIPVYVYALASVLVMLGFLGGLSHVAISELSVKNQVEAIEEKTKILQTNQEIQQKTLNGVQIKLSEVDEYIESTGNRLSAELDNQKEDIKKNAEINRKAVEQTTKILSKQITDQREAIIQSVEAGDQNQQKLIEGIQGRIFLFDETLNDFKKQLGDQTELMKANDAQLAKNDVQLAKNMDFQLTNVKEDLAELKSKQKDEIDDIIRKLEQLEATLVAPKSMLKSNSNVGEVKGVGPNKTADLNDIGIASVSDFVMADPKVVAERLGSSEKTVEKLQGRAQLQMIPGIKEKDLLLLDEIDITDRKSLAMADPIELGKKLNAIFKVNLANGKVLETDKPTIEEVVSWVKYTRG